ncbi:MAG: acyl-coenzyme A synthetase/AMP-(fatty) acid ligase, partial [Myxococcota bacterium]
MNLSQLLEDHAETRGAVTAIIEGTSQLTFAELRDRARAMSEHLRTLGLSPGSKAVVFVPMSIDLYVVLLGLWHLGAVPVFVDPAMGRPQIEAAITLAEPDLFIAIRKAHWFRLISSPIRKIPRHLVSGSRRLSRALDAADVSREPAVLDSEAPGLLTFTSGTTGAPKGNLRSHGFLLAQHRALHEVLALGPSDVDMPALPIFLLNTLASGTTAVIPPIGKRVADIDGAAFYRTLVE